MTRGEGRSTIRATSSSPYSEAVHDQPLYGWRQYVGLFADRWWVLVMAVLVCGVTAGALAVRTPKVYESTVKIFVSTASTTGSVDDQRILESISGERVTAYAELVRSRALIADARVDLGLTTPIDQLSRMIRITTTFGPLLRVSARSSRPSDAASLAQAVADRLAALVQRLETPAGHQGSLVRATVLDRAVPPVAPIEPRPIRAVFLGIGLGFGIGCCVVVLEKSLRR